MSDQDSSWNHVDDAFKESGEEARLAEVDVTTGGGEESPSEPPKLDRRIASDPGETTEVPDAFMQQCQGLWRQAMNIAGEAYQRMKSELTQRIDTLTVERDSLLAERDALKKEFEEFRHATSSKVEHLTQYETQLADAKAALELEQDSQKRKDRELEERDRQLEEALQAVGANEGRMQEAEAALQQEVELRKELETRLQQASADAEASSDSDDLRTALNRTSSKLEVITGERDRLNRDLNEAFETINFSMERSRQLEQELTEAKAAVARQEARVDEVKARVAEMDGEVAVLRKKNELVNREAQAFAEKNAELLRRFHEASIPVPAAD